MCTIAPIVIVVEIVSLRQFVFKHYIRLFNCFYINYTLSPNSEYKTDKINIKDVVTPYTHIPEASRYILYTKILIFDGICTIS